MEKDLGLLLCSKFGFEQCLEMPLLMYADLYSFRKLSEPSLLFWAPLAGGFSFSCMIFFATEKSLTHSCALFS